MERNLTYVVIKFINIYNVIFFDNFIKCKYNTNYILLLLYFKKMKNLYCLNIL